MLSVLISSIKMGLLDKFIDEIEEVYILSIGKNNSYSIKTPMNIECVPAGVTFEFTITIDKDILADFAKKIPFNSIEDILIATTDFSTDIIKEEFSFERNGVEGARSLEQGARNLKQVGRNV